MKADNTGSHVSVWDHQAGSYDETRQTDPVYHYCISKVNNMIPKGVSLGLDAGCGTGVSSIGFACQAKAVVALDYSLESLKALQSKGVPNVLLVQAELSALPFIDSAFDYTTCVNTLQHFRPGSSQENAVSELRRVTKNKSKILVSVHHYSRAKQKARWVKEGEPGQSGVDYIFRFERRELQQIMPTASIISVGSYWLCEIRFLGCFLQSLIGSLFGQVYAILGLGHMLVGVEQNDKDK